jgi:hypothetical protein
MRTKEHNLSRSRNYKPCSTKSEKTCAYFTKPSSESARRAYIAEGLERAHDVNRRIIEDWAGEPLVFN